jgi:hypothetical protein
MSSFHRSLSGLELGLRWTARLLAAGLVGLVLLIYVGEGGPNPFNLSALEAVQKTLFLTACVGLVVAWRWQFAGGVLSTVAMVLFLTIEFEVTGGFPKGLVFDLMLVASILFLVCGLLRTYRPKS